MAHSNGKVIRDSIPNSFRRNEFFVRRVDHGRERAQLGDAGNNKRAQRNGTAKAAHNLFPHHRRGRVFGAFFLT